MNKRSISRALPLALVLVLLLVSLGGCSVASSTRGNGRMTNGSFSHDGSITKIDISVPATFNITPNKSNEITYTIDDNLKDLLDITYRNGVLKIATKNNRTIMSNKITFNIGADALEAITTSGAAVIRGNGAFAAESFALNISGAGSVELALNAQRVSVHCSGAASISLSGTTNELGVDISGAATINTRNLIAQNVTAKLSGAGSIQVHAENKLDASVTGVGSITYWGDPELTPSTVGVSLVKKGN